MITLRQGGVGLDALVVDGNSACHCWRVVKEGEENGAGTGTGRVAEVGNW